jgi:hypothetical protein
MAVDGRRLSQIAQGLEPLLVPLGAPLARRSGRPGTYGLKNRRPFNLGSRRLSQTNAGRRLLYQCLRR